VTVIGVLVLAVVLGCCVLFVSSWAKDQRPTTEAAYWFAQDHEIGSSDDAIELSWRYLDRARRYRFLGFYAGLLVGIATVSPWLLISWLPGWFVGVIASEFFRLRPSRRGPRTASLRRRSAERYRSPGVIWQTRALAALCVLLAATDALVPWRTSLHVSVIAAAGACAVLAVTEVCEHAIAARTRPALPAHLEGADDAIRRVGAKAVGFAGCGVGVLLFTVCLNVTASPHAPSYGRWHNVLGIADLALIAWAISLAVEEHRVFWPKIPRERRRRLIKGVSRRTPIP
jgi:hypothetical protein